MPLYFVHVLIEDDPASFSADVLVVAETERGALAAAKRAAKSHYLHEAGGWGIASQTKIVDWNITETNLPKKGVVMVSGNYSR